MLSRNFRSRATPESFRQRYVRFVPLKNRPQIEVQLNGARAGFFLGRFLCEKGACCRTGMGWLLVGGLKRPCAYPLE